MFKKIIILVFLFFLTACNTTKEETIKEEYIEPVNDFKIADVLNVKTRTKIKNANKNKDFDNYQFFMLNKDIFDLDLKDLNGNYFNLKNYSKVILQVVSIDCSYCHKIISSNNNQYFNNDIFVVQYFNDANAKEILALYENLNMSIPDNLKVVEENEDLKEYLTDYLKMVFYPTSISFLNGKLTCSLVGDFSLGELGSFIEVSFNDLITDLNDQDGNSILDKIRTVDDVKNSLSTINQEKIKAFCIDEQIEELTYKLLAKDIDFNNLKVSEGSNFINEVNDFKEYENQDLIIFYTFLQDESKIDKVTEINKIIDDNPDYEYLVVLIEGFDYSSKAYQNMAEKFHSKVVSTSASIPNDLFSFTIYAYPTAIFIKDNKIMGLYSDSVSKEKFKEALNLFMLDERIALIKNN